MPPRSKRTKRDSAGNLYKHCLLGGDCIPDVVNKYENKTPADKILQIGGSLTYFGGLGIGTGKGTGGTTGYRPLGGDTGVRVGGAPSVIRPNVPIDPVGPVDVLPIDTLSTNTEVPSVIPMVDEGSVPPIGAEVEIVGEAGVTGGGPLSGPTVSSTSEETAILEVGSSSSSTPRQRVSRQQYNNPSFTPLTHSTPTVGEATLGDSILVSQDSTGTIVGGFGFTAGPRATEEIELQTFTGPRSSTPRTQETGLYETVKGLGGRRYVQVQVKEPEFLSKPASLAQFGFENPAFEGDGSFTFPVSEDVEAAPHSAFQDVQNLGRARYTRGPGGRLRVSRVGTRGSMRLRSGTHIGQRLHFYQDLSTIDPYAGIELSVLGEQSGDSTIVLGSSESTLIDVPLGDEEEALLVDELEEDFSNAQLSFTSARGRSVIVEHPTSTPEITKPVVGTDIGEGIFVSHPDADKGVMWAIPKDTQDRTHVPTDGQPSLLWDPSTGTFDLHPGLLRWRRKRRRRHDL
ncbi:L2 [Felis catus papillomavirus 3]|uniref:Minor capsid protein L2 n=1 Tax=Felis catus papillomavirus 3 TaxID=1336600 RepID=R4V8L7_9PAPI|nr:L2 [Felis catus papillomavirus 3]AGM37983.1 L2 [Felis catus papillomavirus 3]